MIDTYYGFPVNGGVRTDLQTLPKRAIAEQEKWRATSLVIDVDPITLM